MTKISVALATFNGAAFIQQQLESLAAQTHLPDEIIVVDDASADETLTVVRAFASTARVRVVIHRNEARLGYRANFQKAMSLCEGDLIAFCDQDDIWDPAKLATAAGQMHDPAIMVWFHAVNLIDAERRFIGTDNDIGYPELTAANQRVTMYSPYGFSIVFRRELLQFASLWPKSVESLDSSNKMAHDQWLFFLGGVFGTIFYNASLLADYRQHPNNVYGASGAKDWREKIAGWFDSHTRDRTKFYQLLHRAAQARADILADAARITSGTMQDNARTGERGYRRFARRLGLRAALYGKLPFKKRIGILLHLRRDQAYTDDHGWGLGRSALIKDVVLGLVLHNVLLHWRTTPYALFTAEKGVNPGHR